MTSTEKRWTAAQIETGLRHIRGVTSVKLVSDAQNVIQEIHATVEGDKSPKQAVRDIEAVLKARYGVTIDHKKISIAQIDESLGYDSPRLRFLDVGLTIEGNRAEATVRLQKEGKAYTGTSRGQRSSSHQLRLTAEATLRAVEAAFQLDELFAIEEVNATLMMGGRPALVVLVNMIVGSGEDVLIGSALIRQDQLKAIALATLDAVNRRVQAFSSKSGSKQRPS